MTDVVLKDGAWNDPCPKCGKTIENGSVGLWAWSKKREGRNYIVSATLRHKVCKPNTVNRDEINKQIGGILDFLEGRIASEQ